MNRAGSRGWHGGNAQQRRLRLAGECRFSSLTWSSLNVSDCEPSVRVLAAYSKPRRDDTPRSRRDSNPHSLSTRRLSRPSPRDDTPCADNDLEQEPPPSPGDQRTRRTGRRREVVGRRAPSLFCFNPTSHLAGTTVRIFMFPSIHSRGVEPERQATGDDRRGMGHGYFRVTSRYTEWRP